MVQRLMEILTNAQDGSGQFYERLAAAFLTAFLVASLGGRRIILWLRSKKVGERTEKTPIEDEKLRSRINTKAGTPTMGGVIIAAGLLAGCLLWGDLGSVRLWLALGCFVSLAGLGMVDDWRKLTGTGHRGRGLRVWHKLAVQGIVGGVLGIALLCGTDGGHSCITLPFLGWTLVLGPLAVVWIALVVATMSNAVNVTDGLDGLAGGLSMAALVPLGFMAWVAGSAAAATAHGLAFVPGAGELCIFCAALLGALAGFLVHNRHPARVFMGDTGSLAVGGSLGAVAVMTRTEALLPLIGFLFLVEFGSSVLQVLWFKATGRRILPIAPVHHIWQRKGWPEQQIVADFHAVGAMLSVIPLLLL